jgi:hypothetical protein
MAFKMNPKSPALKSMGRYATPQAIKPAVTSPAKQTASQKKNLPEAIVKAIAAKSPAKQMGVDAGETAAFEKSKAIEERADAKMQKAKGNKNRQAQIIKNTRKKQAVQVPKAKKKAEQKGYKKLPAKSPAKIRKANSTKRNNQPTAGVESKKTSKFMRKAGTLASGGGQDRNVTRSPAKQKVNRDDGVQVKEVPKVVGEEVKKATDFVGKEGKKAWGFLKRTVKKIGNVKLTPTKKEKIKKAKEKLEKLNKKQ